MAVRVQGPGDSVGASESDGDGGGNGNGDGNGDSELEMVAYGSDRKVKGDMHCGSELLDSNDTWHHELLRYP